MSSIQNNCVGSVAGHSSAFCGPAPVPEELVAELQEFGVIDSVGDTIECEDGTRVAICMVRDILSSTIEEIRSPLIGGRFGVREVWTLGNGKGQAIFRITTETSQNGGVYKPLTHFEIKVDRLFSRDLIQSNIF